MTIHSLPPSASRLSALSPRGRSVEEHRQFVADAAATAIAHCSADRRFIFVNKAYAERLGLTPDQIVGRSLEDVLGEEVAASIRPYIDRALAGEPVRYEIDLNYPQVGRRYLDCAYTPEFDSDRQVVGWVAAITDITERHRLKEALRENETMLRLAQKAGGMGYFEFDLAARVSVCSPEYFAIFGIDPGDCRMTTETWERFVLPEDLGRVGEEVRLAVEGSGECRSDYRIRRADGEIRWINYTGQVVRDEAGRPVRMIGAILDVTDRKRAEESLREADRRKDEFLATLAHELRNPLAPIRNAVQILQLQGAATPELQWTRDVIDRQVQQLTRLVDDLLDISRITRDKIELRKERVEIAAIVERALETSRPAIEAARHRLTVEISEPALPVTADSTRLAQVVSNLLNNAAKYTPPGGEIRISAGREDGQAVIRVRDNGIGIPREMQSHIFEMFTQVDTSLERAQGGLGIGLTIAKLLVEMHGGEIGVTSEGPGRGSDFIVRLPLASEEAGAGAPEDDGAGAGAGAGLRILVVDDNQDSADSLAVWLRLMGHDARTAFGGSQALEEARAYRPDLVLLDIGMPEMSGYDVARGLREQPETRGAVLVAMTGWGQEEDRRRSKEAGFDEHLVKPLHPKLLCELLANLKRF